jgi:hypothetical protein
MTNNPITLIRSEGCELVADEETKLTFAKNHGQYFFDNCDRQGPETVVAAAGRDAEHELTRRVFESGRSHAACWIELMQSDVMRHWYRLARLEPACDSDRRFTRIVQFRDIPA